MATRQPLLINERVAERTAELVGNVALMGSNEPAMSVLFVPLIVGGEATGEDLAAEPRPRARVQRGRRATATTIAGSLSVALENARLFEEAQRRGTEMAALAELGREVGGCSNSMR